MRKKFGVTFGGLQQKIFTLVLFVIILVIGVFIGTTLFQGKNLSGIVARANDEQRDSINRTTEDTMYYLVSRGLVETTQLQAEVCDDVFADMESSLRIMGDIAGYFAVNKYKAVSGIELYPPDPKNDGKAVPQLFSESGDIPEDSAYLPFLKLMSNSLVSFYNETDSVNACFIGTPDGLFLIVDERSASKYDENGDLKPMKVRERPWYTGAVQKGGIHYTGIELDNFSGDHGITVSIPIYKNNELFAVIGIDVFVDSVYDYVHSPGDSSRTSMIVNESGKVIFSSAESGIFAEDVSDINPDLRNIGNKQLADFIDSALEEVTNVHTVTIDDTEYYMVGAPMVKAGWAVVNAVEKRTTMIPAVKMLDNYNKILDNSKAEYSQGLRKALNSSVILTAIIIIIAITCSLLLARKIVLPIENMTKRISEIGGTNETFKMEDSYRTHDEIEVLAEAFETLSEQTQRYIVQIMNITKETERIGAELELAQRIQASMLPNNFPAFPDRDDIDIFASMTPAKEVGGDFYDFFLIDKDHIGLVMADVSGKGVPAALFMMMSKILIANYAQNGYSPAQVLEHANAHICENNKEEMFVTVWLGVLEISTGKVVAANAGHEYPIIGTSCGSYELFKDKHGFVVGGMESIKYKEYEFTLEKGGTLFLYTDGATEATNADKELFGTDRLLDTLNREKTNDPHSIIENIKNDIDSFVGEAPKFDDLTMMAITLK